MKRTDEALRRFLDHLVVKPNLTHCGLAIGIAEPTTFSWISKSQRAPNEWMIDWPEGEPPLPFHQQILVARKKNVALYEHQIRDEIRNGIPEVVVYNGELAYQRDPELVGRPWLVEMLGLPDDLLRIDGRVVPLVINRAAPAHLKIFAGKGLLPAIYGDHSTVDFRAQVQHTVLRIGNKQPKTIDTAPPQQIEHQHVDEYAPHPDDTPLQADLKRRARELRDKPKQLGDARIVTKPDGSRTIAGTSSARDPDADLEEGLGDRRVPVAAPPRPADPANVQGVDAAGRSAVARGIRTA
jgi:hypothetical protein